MRSRRGARVQRPEDTHNGHEGNLPGRDYSGLRSEESGVPGKECRLPGHGARRSCLFGKDHAAPFSTTKANSTPKSRPRKTYASAGNSTPRRENALGRNGITESARPDRPQKDFHIKPECRRPGQQHATQRQMLSGDGDLPESAPAREKIDCGHRQKRKGYANASQQPGFKSWRFAVSADRHD